MCAHVCGLWYMFSMFVYIEFDVNVYACIVCMYLLCVYMCFGYSLYVLYMNMCVVHAHVCVMGVYDVFISWEFVFAGMC